MNQTENHPMHFVISAPRSGSTWMTRALNSHPDIFATEHRFFGEFCEIWPNNDGTRSPRITLDEFVKAFSVHYFFGDLGIDRQTFIDKFQRELHRMLTKFATDRKACKIIIDKITPYPGTTALVVKKIKQFFPSAKIIHLVRDGRDMVVSAAYDWLLKNAHGTDRYRYFVDNEPGFVLNRFFDDATLEHWAGLWNEVNCEIGVLSDDCLLVRYEDMKSSLEGQLTRIANFFDVGVDPRVIEQCVQSTSFKKLTGRDAGNTDPTAKTRKGIVGDWRGHFTRHDANIFDQIAGNTLQEFGYEDTRQWIDDCPANVEFARNESSPVTD